MPGPGLCFLPQERRVESFRRRCRANLAAVAETAREAAGRVALEGGGTVGSILIRRQVSIVPQPHSGVIEWNISVRGPRESASATADAQGRIRGINLSGTRRAETVDFTKGGDALVAAVETIRNQFGLGVLRRAALKLIRTERRSSHVRTRQ